MTRLVEDDREYPWNYFISPFCYFLACCCCCCCCLFCPKRPCVSSLMMEDVGDDSIIPGPLSVTLFFSSSFCTYLPVARNDRSILCRSIYIYIHRWWCCVTRKSKKKYLPWLRNSEWGRKKKSWIFTSTSFCCCRSFGTSPLWIYNDTHHVCWAVVVAMMIHTSGISRFGV